MLCVANYTSSLSLVKLSCHQQLTLILFCYVLGLTSSHYQTTLSIYLLHMVDNTLHQCRTPLKDIVDFVLTFPLLMRISALCNHLMTPGVRIWDNLVFQLCPIKYTCPTDQMLFYWSSSRSTSLINSRTFLADWFIHSSHISYGLSLYNDITSVDFNWSETFLCL